MKLEKEEGSSHDKLWVGTPRGLEFIVRTERGHSHILSREETNCTGIRVEDRLEVWGWAKSPAGSLAVSRKRT